MGTASARWCLLLAALALVRPGDQRRLQHDELDRPSGPDDVMQLFDDAAHPKHAKKSIDWSKYFGLDRRKKSRLAEVDRKLKGMEDVIVDEAIKYTGANEDLAEPDQVQAAKENLIARLAAVYNLEKMRRAIAEYRATMAAKKEALKSNAGLGNDSGDDLDEDSQW